MGARCATIFSRKCHPPAISLVSKKDKLLARLQQKPKDFSWGEAESLARACGFHLVNKPGSARMFVHGKTATKMRLHEPHPQKTLMPYMLDILIEGLRAAGEIE